MIYICIGYRGDSVYKCVGVHVLYIYIQDMNSYRKLSTRIFVCMICIYIFQIHIQRRYGKMYIHR